ncbi:Rieske (2Fe-2S) protein [Humitalea sp. 24SJ18S-53]|uniref:Rieske (2Fe-2S) protein n=1 Tax=Humitalea sp. 24SJ18S-53 TaxID=3422307 RepID=UPI003D669A3D
MQEVFVGQEDEIPEGGRKVVVAGGIEIGVFRVDGQLQAWRNECPHQGGPVCQGKMMKGVEERLDADRRSLGIHYKEGSLHVVCPWHGYEFDLRTGRHAGLDRIRLAAHKVTVRQGAVFVSVNA